MDKSHGLVLLAIVLSLIDQALSIKCYRCTVMPPNRKNNATAPQWCTKFEQTNEFTIDCPYSTMCMKRVYKYKLLSGVVETVQRDCANQKYSEQVLKENRWQNVYTIEEPYEEGCEEDLNGSIYCHCRGAYCNAAPKTEPSMGYHTDAMAVIFVFNLVKYLRNND